MRVTVKVSTPSAMLPETYTVDIGPIGARSEPTIEELASHMGARPEPTIEELASHFMIHGLVVGKRWISPFRILEFEPVPVPMKLKEGE